MAYSFTAASSQYLSVAASPYATEPFTMAARAYANDTNAIYSILGMGGLSQAIYYWVAFRGDNAGDPIMAQVFNSTSANAEGGTFQATTWTQVSSTFVSATARKIYVDDASVSDTTNLNAGTGSRNFTVGLLDASSTKYYYLNGRIAEVAIWSAELTSDEMASLYKGFKPQRVRPQSLVFYAPLIRNLMDRRGGLTITNNNSATVADHPRVY